MSHNRYPSPHGQIYNAYGELQQVHASHPGPHIPRPHTSHSQSHPAMHLGIAPQQASYMTHGSLYARPGTSSHAPMDYPPAVIDPYHYAARPRSTSNAISQAPPTQHYPHPSHPHSPPQGHVHAHNRSQSLAHAHPPAYPHTRPHGQPTPQSPLSTSQPPSAVAYPSGADQYPASPQRPFACDLCKLSFNRQHDLKRHKETHTGERPFECNGGCGKTFTRKDALKRHQLVKGCGTSED